MPLTIPLNLKLDPIWTLTVFIFLLSGCTSADSNSQVLDEPWGPPILAVWTNETFRLQVTAAETSTTGGVSDANITQNCVFTDLDAIGGDVLFEVKADLVAQGISGAPWELVIRGEDSKGEKFRNFTVGEESLTLTLDSKTISALSGSSAKLQTYILPESTPVGASVGSEFNLHIHVKVPAGATITHGSIGACG